MGRLLFEARTNNGSSAQTYTTGYTYYKDGALDTLTYPSGDVLTYTVSGAGRPTQVSDSSNNYAGYTGSPASYAPQGALAGMTNGHTSSFAGIVTWDAYNDRLQPILLSASTGTQVSTSITSASYSGCPAGSVCAVIFNVSSSAGINVGDEFTVSGDSTSFFNGEWIVSAVAAGQVQADSAESSSQSCSSACGTLIGYTSPPIFSLCYDFHLGISVAACNLKAYTTGDNGNVFQALNNADSTRSAAYIYDPLNRIAQAYTVNTNSANCWGETFSPTATAPGVLPSTPGIDAWGNLTNKAGVSGMAQNCTTEGLSATATTQNHLSGIGLQYDAAGNVTTDNLDNTYTYDTENRIATVAGYTYSYDADGRRMERADASSGTMYWPGPSGTLTETGLTGTINEEYIYFAGRRIARVDRPSGTVHYYFSNHLGSHTMVTNATGGCEQDIDYYPYGGVVIDHCPNVAQHYKFTGKERDTESGLDSFRFRYYGSSLDRFMTPDSAGADRANPQSWNKYAYVLNNPLNTLDPLGLWPSNPATPGISDGLWGGTNCYLDGVATSCGALHTEGVAQCPNNDCSTQVINGQFYQFKAGTGGAQGYVRLSDSLAQGINEANGMFMSNAQYNDYMLATHPDQINGQYQRVAGNLTVLFGGHATADPNDPNVVGGHANFTLNCDDLTVCGPGRYFFGVHIEYDSGGNLVVHDDTVSPWIRPASFSFSSLFSGNFWEHGFVDLIGGTFCNCVFSQ
jgi:RHS repeat-associated protein